MRKSIFLGMVVILMMSFTASAHHVNLGVKIGANMYNIQNSVGSKKDYLPGIQPYWPYTFIRSIWITP